MLVKPTALFISARTCSKRKKQKGRGKQEYPDDLLVRREGGARAKAGPEKCLYL